jgi:hypothetical protein
MQVKLIRFLTDELGIPTSQIKLVLRQKEQIPNHLAMSLWQYGLINLKQLEQIFDWLEAV